MERKTKPKFALTTEELEIVQEVHKNSQIQCQSSISRKLLSVENKKKQAATERLSQSHGHAYLSVRTSVQEHVGGQDKTNNQDDTFRRLSLQEAPSSGNLISSLNVYHPVRVPQSKAHGKSSNYVHRGKNTIRSIASFAGTTHSSR